MGGISGSPIFIKGESSKLIGVINVAVMDNPLSSANLGVYIDAYRLLEVQADNVIGSDIMTIIENED